MTVDHRALILTARPDDAALAKFEALRRAHFPPDRNVVPAHISMFHQLPGSEYDAVVERLKFTARHVVAPHVEVAGVRSLGRGVALTLLSPTLEALRDDLAEAWAPVLIAQDRQGWRPHVTVQNKVDNAVARTTLALLAESFVPWSCRITGIDLWRYLDGPWEHLRTVGLR